MRKIILVIFFIFSLQELFACCAGGEISIAPKSNEISQNPVILIDFMERDYQVYDKLKKAKLSLIDEQGKEITVKVLERNKGFHTYAQILLKPKKKLKKGSKVSLRITKMETENKLQKRFVQKIQSKKWKVNFEKDKIPPRFNEDIPIDYVNGFNSSAPGHGIQGIARFWDNNEYKYNMDKKNIHQIIIEAISEEGKRYLLITTGNKFGIYQGICGANFGLKQDTEYSFKIRLIDFSGNKSKETKEIKFKTGNSKINYISVEELNKEGEKGN